MFKAFQDETGLTQDGALKLLVEAYEFEAAKQTIPDRATEITNFQVKATELIETFMNSLQINQDAESRIRAEFEMQLISKDKTIATYQEKHAEQKNKIDELSGLEQKYLVLQMEKAKIENEMEAMKNSQELLVKQHEKQMADKNEVNSMLAEKLAEAESKAEKYNTLQAERKSIEVNLQKALQTIKDNELMHNRSLKELQFKYELGAEKTARLAEQQHTEALNKLRDEFTNKAENAHNELIQILKKHSEEIRIIEAEKAALNQQIKKLEAQVSELTNQLKEKPEI